jgi:hypothetical protein
VDTRNLATKLYESRLGRWDSRTVVNARVSTIQRTGEIYVYANGLQRISGGCHLRDTAEFEEKLFLCKRSSPAKCRLSNFGHYLNACVNGKFQMNSYGYETPTSANRKHIPVSLNVNWERS